MVRELRDWDKTGGHLEGGKGVATAATQPVPRGTNCKESFPFGYFMYTVQAIQILGSLVSFHL